MRTYKKKKSQFRKKKDIFIEKRQFRISTQGEILGLKKAKREDSLVCFKSIAFTLRECGLLAFPRFAFLSLS